MFNLQPPTINTKSPVKVSPDTVNSKGEGPARANSLFEDNAEFGFGMRKAFKQRRNYLANQVEVLMSEELRAALQQSVVMRKDFDNNGYLSLSLSDLRGACEKFKIPNSSAGLHALFSLLDKDDHGAVDIGEFTRNYQVEEAVYLFEQWRTVVPPSTIIFSNLIKGFVTFSWVPVPVRKAEISRLEHEPGLLAHVSPLLLRGFSFSLRVCCNS